MQLAVKPYLENITTFELHVRCYPKSPGPLGFRQTGRQNPVVLKMGLPVAMSSVPGPITPA
jgi:hypothetical protein